LLRAICAWREETARREDLPRNRVVDEKTVVALAREPAVNRAELNRAGMNPRAVRKFGDDLLEIIDAALAVPPQEWPAPLPESAGAGSNERLKALRRVVEERAESLGVAPEMLARRRHLEELLRRGELPASLEGWRRPVIGDRLLQALAEGD